MEISEEERLDNLIFHIENVQDNAKRLVEKLRSHGQFNEDFYRKILCLAYKHDNSKFSGIEWQYLYSDMKIDEPENFQYAAESHIYKNNHHPEYWGGIKKIPPPNLAILICDWKSRSEEFGSDFIEWIDKEATLRYNFSAKDRVYKVIMNFAKLLIEEPFK